MPGEKNLSTLLKGLNPQLHKGNYVFCTVKKLVGIPIESIDMFLREKEGITLILKQKIADQRKLEYSFVASWITLNIHSSLEAVGLTAAFSKILAENNMSCNVVSGYFHDHIFIDKKDALSAIKLLNNLSK